MSLSERAAAINDGTGDRTRPARARPEIQTGTPRSDGAI